MEALQRGAADGGSRQYECRGRGRGAITWSLARRSTYDTELLTIVADPLAVAAARNTHAVPADAVLRLGHRSKWWTAICRARRWRRGPRAAGCRDRRCLFLDPGSPVVFGMRRGPPRNGEAESFSAQGCSFAGALRGSTLDSPILTRPAGLAPSADLYFYGRSHRCPASRRQAESPVRAPIPTPMYSLLDALGEVGTWSRSKERL